MYLPLAEKMTLKYIHEGKLEAEAGFLIFFILIFKNVICPLWKVIV